MSYFNSFQSWLYHTSIYQNLLRELPAPLNNICFDSLLCIFLLVYLIYRLVEAVHIIRYRKKIRKKQEAARRLQREKDQELLDRERRVSEKEERIGKFFDYMDSLFVGKMRQQEASFHGGGSQNGRKLLGRKHFFLEKRDPVADEMQNQMAPVNDYDAAMGAFASEEEQNRQIQRLREQEERQLHSNLESLDASLHGDACTDVVDMPEEEIRDQKLEKRMSRARREDEKERRRKEKRLKRENKRKQHESG